MEVVACDMVAIHNAAAPGDEGLIRPLLCRFLAGMLSPAGKSSALRVGSLRPGLLWDWLAHSPCRQAPCVMAAVWSGQALCRLLDGTLSVQASPSIAA